MQPYFSSIRLSIVDLLGISLPGMVWAILILSLFNCQLSESDSLIDICQKAIGLNAGSTFPIQFYIGLIIVGFVLGYILRVVTLGPIEFFITLSVFITKKIKLNKTERKKLVFNDWMFPYYAIHSSQSYFVKNCEIVEKVTGLKWEQLPGPQPFIACKQLLKVHVPTLWEESEKIEAVVRMLGSLILAFVFAVIVQILFWGFELKSLIMFFTFLLILSYSFRHTRKKEVYYLYLFIVMSQSLILKGQQKKQ